MRISNYNYIANIVDDAACVHVNSSHFNWLLINKPAQEHSLRSHAAICMYIWCITESIMIGEESETDDEDLRKEGKKKRLRPTEESTLQFGTRNTVMVQAARSFVYICIATCICNDVGRLIIS